MTIKVLVSDKLSPLAAEIFTKRGIHVDTKIGLSPEELEAIIGEYHGLAIRSSTTVTKEILAKATNLKVVGRAGIGVDNVDVPAASAHGVVVMNTPFGNSVTTAEHTIAMMMSLARSIPQASSSTHQGKWEKNRFMGTELYGKTLGLIGCGNIGSIVADRAHGLKMKVVAFDPYLSPDRARDIHVEKVELDELFARADFITLHTPLNEGTRNIIGKTNIAKMKKGVYIINCARGGLIHEGELKEALEAGHVAGAALDVFEIEPAKENILFGLDNVICTPHLGASTGEAQVNVALQVAEQMADYLLDGSVTNAVNMPSVSAEDAAKLRPYFTLAEQLGSFAGQIIETGIKEIHVEYLGSVSKLNTKPLTAVALKGLLSALMDGVNMVNAPVIAKDRNIRVSETTSPDVADYQSLIRINVTTERRTRNVSGTLFAGSPRIVELHGTKLEASTSARMLYVNNEDKPGLIGALGKLLGDAQINIANFHLGRNAEGSDAVALVEVDQDISPELKKAIAELPSVKQVQVIAL
ncbi:MAG: phosphoglycerate dehydrogenase [Alphaproteobacteria bacterium]|nr:MAG: phosphoglycerate dehydrogenase [Alphaproteobacteria bacterium]